MSQAITLPQEIVTNVFAPHDGKLVKFNQETTLEKIKDYAREVAMVAIILSDNYIKQLYEKSQIGYIACIDTLHDWATEFVTKYAHVTEWEEFLSTDKTFGNCLCWDDFVIAYGNMKLENYPQ